MDEERTEEKVYKLIHKSSLVKAMLLTGEKTSILKAFSERKHYIYSRASHVAQLLILPAMVEGLSSIPGS